MFHQLRDWGRIVTRELWEVTKQATGEAIGKKAVEKTTEAVFRDLRGELLTDLAALPQEDTRNLWRRHREASAAKRENRFVTLLTKIPREKRAEIFVILDRASDEEFEQALNLLEHDVIPQFLGRVWQRAGKTLRPLVAEVDRAAGELVPKIKQFNQQLETIRDRVKARVLQKRQRR